MRRLLIPWAVTAAYALACNGRTETDTASSASAKGNGESSGVGGTLSAAGPYRITCSVYHRDLAAGVNEHAQTSLVFMTDEPSEKTTVLPAGAIPVHAKLAAALDAPDLVELTIAFPRSDLEQHFRLARDKMPSYELIGYHGFTGLNYVTTPGSSVDVQFVCEASPRSEERPRPIPTFDPCGSAPPDPPAPPPPTPFRVRCDATEGEGASAKTESIVLDGNAERTLVVGGRSVEIRLFDDPYEARGFVVRFADRLQQLYQLDRTMPVVDVTRGPGGFTGRTIVRSAPLDGGAESDGGANDVVSLACSAATN